MVEWLPGERITLRANPAYWDGPPRVDNLVFVAIRDARQRLAALEGGGIDVAENLEPEDLQFVALHPELELHRVAGTNVGYLAMNVTHPPFNDVRVRQAINYAVNKTAIVKLIYQGLAVPATSPVPPAMWGHVDEPLYAYAPDQARRLLADAAYKQPAVRPRRYTLDTPRSSMPAPERVARIIQHNLADVGIDVEVVANDVDGHLRIVQSGQHDLALLGWTADSGDPDNFLYVLFDADNAQPGSARNIAFYRNPVVHDKLGWAQESSDRSRREEYYRDAQDLIARDAPWVPLAHAEMVVAARTSLVGVAIHPFAVIYFQGVYRR
jgi:peptide/nickel transport system substrate-binding protein